jgi:hypothetical protein
MPFGLDPTRMPAAPIRGAIGAPQISGVTILQHP